MRKDWENNYKNVWNSTWENWIGFSGVKSDFKDGSTTSSSLLLFV